VWVKMVTADELQQISSIQEEQDWSEDRTLRISDPIYLNIISLG